MGYDAGFAPHAPPGVYIQDSPIASREGPVHRFLLPILFVCATTLLGGVAASQGGKPNILLLVADDLGVDMVGAYGEGGRPAPTPNIDALAARGVLFRNAWAYASCSPARASMHTGRHAFRTFVGAIPGNGGGIMSPAEITLPEVLDRANTGYEHALIGKWHLGQRHGGSLAPNVAGWSHFAGLLGGATPYYSWPRTVNGATRRTSVYATTKMVDDALAWIQGRSGPWFCTLSFNAPHTPLHVPPPPLHTQRLEGLAPSANPPAFFRAIVEAMDTEIGRLLAALGPALQNTVVVFLSDNGTEPLVTLPPFVKQHAKGTPYEGGVNVPLLVAGPIVSDPGREEAALVSAIDLFATIAEIAGADLATAIPPWVPIDSVSMVPYLDGTASAALRSTVFAEKFQGDDWSASRTNGFATIRNARFKLIRWYPLADAAPNDELYDLDADPFEAVDLLDAPLQGEALANYMALRQELAQLRQPSALVVPFGASGCVGSHGSPSIRATAPRTGGHYAVKLENAPASASVVLLTGTSTSSWGALALPFDLASLGGGVGCSLFHSVEIVVAATTTPTGRASVSIPVPETGALVGDTVFHSWLITDDAAPGNALGLTTTGAVAAVVGL